MNWKKVSQDVWELGCTLCYRIALNRTKSWTVTRGIRPDLHLFMVSGNSLEMVKAACEADYSALRKQIDSFEDEIILKGGMRR